MLAIDIFSKGQGLCVEQLQIFYQRGKANVKTNAKLVGNFVKLFKNYIMNID